MGCDIHLFVERLTTTCHWESMDQWSDADEDGRRRAVRHYYEGRNYELFGILAGVRNRGGFKPIAAPRGLPPDVSEEVRQESEAWGEDGHSHSHLTVAELMAYDWTQRVLLKGYVDARTFEEWERLARWEPVPRKYCQDVMGNIRKVGNDEMRLLIKIGANTDRVYTLVQWLIPYHTAVREFLSETLPRLWRLGPPEEVRIVFWFDN